MSEFYVSWDGKYASTSGAAASGGSTVVSGFQTASLLLASAALTGGIQIAAATGSVPQRLTTAVETYVTGAVAMTRPGLAFGPQGAHFWVTDRTNGQIKRYAIDTGVIDVAITGSTTDPTRNVIQNPECLKNGFGNRLWFASTTNHMVGFVDATTLACEMFSGSGLPSNPSMAVEHLAGRILVRTGGGNASTYTEFAYSGTGSANTIAYTGAQIIEGTTFHDACADLSGNVYTINNTGGVINKRSATTLTSSAAFTPIGTADTSLPGYSAALRMLVYHPQAAMLYTRQSTEDSWLAINAGTMVPAGRVFAGSEFGNPPGAAASTTFFRQMMDFAPDGSRMVFFTYDRETNAAAVQHFRTIRLNPQRARWTWTPGANSTVVSIFIPGAFENGVGSIANMPANTWLNSEYDLRHTKFYYSLDGGSTRTEFRQGEQLYLAVSSAQTLTIDAEFQHTPMNQGNAVDPYIGDKLVAGLGGAILYSTP